MNWAPGEIETFRKWKDCDDSSPRLGLIFFAGFGVGYATRAWRSHKRQERYRLYAPYSLSTRDRDRRGAQPEPIDAAFGSAAGLSE